MRILSCGEWRHESSLSHYGIYPNVSVDHMNNVELCLQKDRIQSPHLAYGEMEETVHWGEHYSPSPFPFVDRFLKQNVISRGGVEGSIRSWLYFPESGYLIYNISQNRYCENIGRAHRSNHVFYVVDLRAKLAFQKCYDPGKKQASLDLLSCLLSDILNDAI